MGVKRDLVSFWTHDWVCVTNWTCFVLNVNILKVFSARTSHLQFNSNISPLTFSTAHWWESSILRKHVQVVV
ncbi:hypothetical protein Pyn_32866 [Prunus yedoensis var. nudiflora]|uniref:Uncharacterized protein n=1 Tax=Prunus yedoensis var. nudiflora TaxID=2094558 RepID=A0A314XMM7_PRUYE|nr:hypothetical protein Pyn_32866 [Prunus yedoensis var. nudiflora]